ncbi:MAG: DUF1127 domain-containing protein [Pseudomonadota bacterium]
MFHQHTLPKRALSERLLRLFLNVCRWTIDGGLHLLHDLSEAHIKWRTKKRLRELSDHMLHDIGVRREDLYSREDIVNARQMDRLGW